MANNIFRKNNILIKGLLGDSFEFLQRTYNQTRNVFTVSSAWGQILFVLENLSQLILYFIEDSITELNMQEATRSYSIKSLARIAGYDPVRGMSAQGEASVAWNLREDDAGGGAVILSNNPKVQSIQNGLPYTIILNSPSVKIPLTRGKKYNFKIVQGSFASSTFTGTGLSLQSFNLPSKAGAYIDQFYVDVYVNGNKWERYESLYDIPFNGEGYLVKSGIGEGIDIYFGNNNFGKIPQSGSIITVEYLQTSGFSGNLQSRSDTNLTYRFLDSGTDLFGNDVNLNNYLTVTGLLDPSFGADPEPIELTRLVAPKTSRSYVFANPENYEIYLQKLNIFSQIQAFSTFDDEYLDDDNVVYIFLVPDVTISLTSNQDYFDIPQSQFLLTQSQKLSLLNLIEDSGRMIATTVVKILDSEIKRFVGNVSMSIFEGYDPEILKDIIRERISEYMLNLKRRDRIPKSDIIAIIEGVEGVDSVSFFFVGEDNERYHETVDNLSNASNAQLERQIGMDEYGDIIIGRGELVLLRGGWSDRYGTTYEEGIVTGKPSALNISISSINPRNFLNELNAKAKANLVNADRNSLSNTRSMRSTL
jgi:hypothetical protein